MNDVITKEVFFKHSIDSVWNAISKAEEIATWFIECDFKAEVGYQYTFNSSKEDCSPIMGEVKSATPYTLIYTWVVQDNPVETTVKWELKTVAGGTQLSLEHSGISGYTSETALSMFNSFNGGWENCMLELGTYLTKLTHAG
ncbi:SRPBCC family protein [Spongiimicrobium salis]|uniref:SRPBCC family protein n=1 Tax=Spongiimicrobium salis TaxID=1667022 RepID=UPI00374D4ED2